MKIYTRSGDKGTTSLIYGRRIDKDALRVQTYGTVDEANSVLGVALSLLPKTDTYRDLQSVGQRIQRDLFDVGRDLATPDDKRDGFYLTAKDVETVEKCIDHFSQEFPPLTQFILPGGHSAAAAFHQARTVTRRAERLLVTLLREEALNPILVKYVNRLSDLFFIMARTVNHRTKATEPGVDFSAQKEELQFND